MIKLEILLLKKKVEMTYSMYKIRVIANSKSSNVPGSLYRFVLVQYLYWLLLLVIPPTFIFPN